MCEALAELIGYIEELNKRLPKEASLDKIIKALKNVNKMMEEKKNALWKNNEQCPECGQKANQEIRACETGYSYCSEECATKHVNDNAPEGGY